MNLDAEGRGLFVLGRRVERLFFWGIPILLVCFFEVYLATATTSFAEDKFALGLRMLADELERDGERLSRLFERKPRAPLSKLEQDRSRTAVAATRKKLGLPPATSKPAINEPTYVEALRELAFRVELRTALRRSDFERLLDAKKPPASLIEDIVREIAQINAKPVKVWGIETPRILPLQYGSVGYKIPADIIAAALAIALAPLIVGWLGSVYITRQRELMIVADIEDYKLAFPHVLNLLPVAFDKVGARIGIRQKPKHRGFSLRFNRRSLAVLRTLIILMFAGPMVSAFVYAVLVIWGITLDSFPFALIVGLLVSVVMLVQVAALVVQEWVVLHGKEFYE